MVDQTFFYSAETGGFYVSSIHGDNMPLDVIEISAEDHFLLLEGQSAGSLIIAGNNGYPVLIERQDAAPSLDILKNNAVSLIQRGMDSALEQGYMTTLNIKKDAKLTDLQQLKAGYDLAVLLGETTMSIVDYNNVVHADLPLTDIETIMGEVGANYRAQFFKKQQKRAAILAATTPEAVAAVVWD